MGSRIVLSIIIANWNSRDLVRTLLTSIYAHKPEMPVEVIVIDNGSEDGSAGMIEKEFPAVRCIKNANNLGYSRATNQGYRASEGEYVLLLGSDTVIIDNSPQRMLDYLRSHCTVGAVCCRLLNPDRTEQGSCKRFPTLWDGAMTYLSLHVFARKYNISDFDFHKTQRVEQPAATCLMIRRGVVEHVGLFDEQYTILYNDVDLCKRIWSASWEIVYLGDAEIIHHRSVSTRHAGPELRLEMYRNILIYYFNKFGVKAVAVLLPILAIRLAITNRGRRVVGLFSLGYLFR